MHVQARQPACPPRTHTDDGRIRRVGVEIEFGGLGGGEAAKLVRDVLGGCVDRLEPFSWAVEGTRFGTFEVALDWSYAHLLNRDTLQQAQAGHPTAMLKRGLTQAVGELGARILPYEITSPPLAFGDLGALEDLIAALRDRGAHGTRQDVMYAFALQLNPEAFSLEVGEILNLFRAYLVMSDWLRREIGVDLTRRLSGMAGPFPGKYVRRVLSPAYAPTLGGFIDDYLEANPTRDRELDLLPLFAYLDEARVRRKVRDALVKPRPTYHYRLPDSRVDDPAWGVLVEWARWVEVERLAARPRRLEALAAGFLHRDDASGRWADTVDRYLA